MGSPDEHAATAVSTPTQRFLTKPTVALIALYLVFTATFASYSVNNDGQVYLDFMRRLTGEHVTSPSTHQFGSAVFALPFFLVARVLGVFGVHSLGGAPLEQVSMVVASTVALLVIAYLGWRLLRDLDLPGGPGLLALVVVGTPLFYYAVFQPTYKHVIDTLYVMVMVTLVLRALRRPNAWLYVALGACLAVSIITRTANAALVPGMILPFLLRRQFGNAARAIAATAVVTVALLAVGSLAAHNSVGAAFPHITVVHSSTVAASDLIVANSKNFFICHNHSANLTFKQCIHDVFGIWPSPSAPFKMLFTLHRGLFLWTPLTALAVFGFVLLIRRRRDERDFLLGLAVAALGLWFVHFLWGDFWDGGFSFSERFLTALFPVFLLGAAELIRRRRNLALAGLSLCAAFSLVLALTFETGYKGISSHDGVNRIVRLYTSGERTPQQLVRKLGVQARERWLGH
jgi:hypothetical protein